MLQIERRVLRALIEADHPGTRAGVESFVAGALAAMPAPLRAGVAVQSVLVAALVAARRGDVAAVVDWLEASPLAIARQYVRLLRSLARFAELELGSRDTATRGAGAR